MVKGQNHRYKEDLKIMIMQHRGLSILKREPNIQDLEMTFSLPMPEYKNRIKLAIFREVAEPDNY